MCGPQIQRFAHVCEEALEAAAIEALPDRIDGLAIELRTSALVLPGSGAHWSLNSLVIITALEVVFHCPRSNLRSWIKAMLTACML